ncbi:MAG: acyl-ACP--UDP-N-acetylglucosamine O-acyltransferase [Phycisphaerae bacterium]|jgi:UDP-N-acetylglucosamine acyltransferase
MAIHPTAIIDPKAELDSTVEVGPYCVIEGHVRVAARCRLYQGVYLTGWTTIGEDSILHPFVIVGHEPQDVKYKGQRTFCRIGRRAVLREHVTVHRGTIPDSETMVGDDCFLLAGCHVAHNCVVGDNVTLINNVLLAGHVEVADRVTMGGSSVAHQFVRIGELAMLAGKARVTQDILPFALVAPGGRIAGLNRVGLRRAGLTREEFNDIRLAYRILFASGLSLPDAIERMAREVRTEPGKGIVQFLRHTGPRGLAGRDRRQPTSAPAADAGGSTSPDLTADGFGTSPGR